MSSQVTQSNRVYYLSSLLSTVQLCSLLFNYGCKVSSLILIVHNSFTDSLFAFLMVMVHIELFRVDGWSIVTFIYWLQCGVKALLIAGSI